MNTRVVLTIPAPLATVWHALTDVATVTRWAAVTPHDIPPGYPAAGQHALWWDRTVLLHDHIVRVEPLRRLVSRLTVGPWLANEEYVIQPRGPRATVLRATWSGHPTMVGTERAMRRLSDACRGPA